MKRLTDYIKESKCTLDEFIGSYFKKNFKVVKSIPKSELSGKDTEGEFKIGDTIYRDRVRGANVIGGKDEYNIPYKIARIMKADKPWHELGYESKYHIWCEANNSLGWIGDWANNFFNAKH